MVQSQSACTGDSEILEEIGGGWSGGSDMKGAAPSLLSRFSPSRWCPCEKAASVPPCS